MYPHERSLVKELENKSFTLLGVNSDKKDRVQKAMKKENITWRSFWDGGNTRGPIATRWGVTGWPTVYVLDHEGKVRYQGTRGDDMTRVVKHLLAEMKK